MRTYEQIRDAIIEAIPLQKEMDSMTDEQMLHSSRAAQDTAEDSGTAERHRATVHATPTKSI